MSRRTAILIFTTVLGLALLAAIIQAASSAENGGSIAGSGSYMERFEVNSLEDEGGSDVAIVPIEGVIVDGDGDPAAGQVGGDTIVGLLRELGDEGVDGIILRVDTPGGAVLASAEIAAELERLQAEDVKVVSLMRGTAASGGYYVSAGADRIIASPSTFTGSIGVILSYVTVEGLADKIGVTPVVIKSGEFKDIGSPFRGTTAEERKIFQALIDEAYGEFVNVVAEGRDMPEDEARRLADGRIYSGSQAKEVDLVDELGDQDAAYDAMRKLLDDDDLTINEYVPTYDFFTSFFGASAFDALLGREGAQALDAVSALRPSSPGSVSATSPNTPVLEYRWAA